MQFFKEITITTKKLKSKGLRKYREEHNIGVRELARACKLSPSTISAIEMGKCHVRIGNAILIEKTLVNMVKYTI